MCLICVGAAFRLSLISRLVFLRALKSATDVDANIGMRGVRSQQRNLLTNFHLNYIISSSLKKEIIYFILKRNIENMVLHKNMMGPVRW